MSVATATYTIVHVGSSTLFTAMGRVPQPWVLVSLAEPLGDTAAVVAELVAIHGDATRIYYLGAGGRVCELVHREGRYVAAARGGCPGTYCGRCNFLLAVGDTDRQHHYCPHCGPVAWLPVDPEQRNYRPPADYICYGCSATMSVATARHENYCCPHCGKDVEVFGRVAQEIGSK